MSKPKLSIIIPNYNEKENINAGVLQQVADYLKKFPIPGKSSSLTMLLLMAV